MADKIEGGKGKPPINTQPAHTKPFNLNDPSEGGSHKFGTMVFTPEQWKKFINNLVQMILNQLKIEEKRIKKAQQELKNAIEGKPLD